MSFIQAITNEELWVELLQREEEKDIVDNKAVRSIKSIIDKKKYLEYHNIFDNFPLARRVELKEYNTSKVRVVYVYPWKYRMILKAMSFYILKNYNSKFMDNSLAYTWDSGVNAAFRKIKSFKLKNTDVVYKNDFKDYFNRIDIEILEHKLKDFLGPNTDLVELIMPLLKEPNVIVNGKCVQEPNKGVMAGSPISGILANIYMHEVDEFMKANNYKYLRYADDTIVVGKEALNAFKEQLKKLKVELNPKKTQVMTLETGIDFLGFTHIGRDIIISKKAVDKMKSRMKRRAKWYKVWCDSKNIPYRRVIRHYIKGINEKLYSNFTEGVNWSRWYLPHITNIDALKYLDQYFVNCIRYLNSGTWSRNKHYYKLTYKDIKAAGFRSLVNEYYKMHK